MSPWLTVVLMALVGTGIGVLTGLTPGLHVNTMALLLLSATGTLYAVLGGGLGIAVVIAAAATAHTFLDFIPSAFLGIPEEDTALAVLPAHQMVLEGHGFEAVCLSALGSAAALMTAVAILVPFRIALIDLGVYRLVRGNIVPLLIGLCALLVISERGRSGLRIRGMLSATFVLVLSGALGMAVLRLRPAPLLDLPGSILFPLLSGVFGIPPLVASLSGGGAVPPQCVAAPAPEARATVGSVLAGTLSGSVLGFLPGMTSAHATVLSMLARGERRVEQTIVTLSSVNTANAFYSIMAIFVIGRGRSGTALAIQEIVDAPLWTEAPPGLLYHIAGAVLLAGALSYVLTLAVGALSARAFSRLPYRAVTAAILSSLVGLVLLFTGLIGLAVMAVAALVGQVPVELGVRRSHAMGVLLVPVILRLA